MSKTFLMTIFALALVSLGQTEAALIPGPNLNQPVLGHSDSGLQFTAITNSTLTSFIFQNQGNADVIALEPVGGGSPIFSLAVPAGNPSLLVNVNWNLVAGDSYWLLQTVGSPTQNNGRFGDFSGAFPVSDSDISVTVGVFSDNANNNNWGDFNNITTNNTIPEPSTLSLAALAFASLSAWQLRRR